MTALVLVAGAALFTASAADKNKKAKTATVKLNDEADSLSYALGVSATRGLIPYLVQTYKVDTAYMADFISGYQEAIKNTASAKGTAYLAGGQIAMMVAQRILPGCKEEYKSTKDSISEQLFHQGFMASLANDTTFFSQKAADELKKDVLAGAGIRFLAENAKKEGVKTTASGLQYKVLTEGHGEVPKATDEVEVFYEGRLLDGTVFDATYKHPAKKDMKEGDRLTDKFKAGNLIKGWTEALTMMPVGSKWELYIPQELAYGSRQAGQIPPYSTLIFTLELIDIVKPQVEEPQTEENVAPATTAETTVKKTATAKKAAMAKKTGKRK